MKVRYTIVLPVRIYLHSFRYLKEEVAAARIQEVPDGLKLTVSVTMFTKWSRGIRTPDLHRAKSEHYHRGRSLLFKNTTPKVGVPLLEQPAVHLEDGASLP
jgi:hypothetical protein